MESSLRPQTSLSHHYGRCSHPICHTRSSVSSLAARLVSLLQIPDEGMSGKVQLKPDFPEDLTFTVGKQYNTVVCDLYVHAHTQTHM